MENLPANRRWFFSTDSDDFFPVRFEPRLPLAYPSEDRSTEGVAWLLAGSNLARHFWTVSNLGDCRKQPHEARRGTRSFRRCLADVAPRLEVFKNQELSKVLPLDSSH
jgi:hypothetical protein